MLNAKDVLDLGCGTGTMCFYAASKDKKVLGIDISKNAITLAKLNSKKFELSKKIRFINGDISKLNIKEKFDLIICTEVLEHVKNESEVLHKIHKLLKPSGIIISSSPSVNAPLLKLGLLSTFDKEVGHLRRYSGEKYKLLFEKNGYHVIEVALREGVLRNFLFTNNTAGKLIKFVKGPLVPVLTYIDNIFKNMFGESQIILAAKKS